MSGGSEFIEWIEKHPWQTGGAVFAIGVIIVLYFNSGSSAAPTQSTSVSGYDPGYNAAVVAANSQLSIAQQQAQVQSNAQQAALSANVNNNATAVSLATIQAQAGQTLGSQSIAANEAIASQNIAANLSLGSQQIGSNTTLGLASFDTSKIINQSNNDTSLGLAAISASVQTQANNNATALQSQQQQAQFLGQVHADDANFLLKAQAQNLGQSSVPSGGLGVN